MPTNTAPKLSDEAVAALRQAVWGTVLLPSDAEWTKATQCWLLSHTPPTPAIVVQCRGVMDVQAALAFAKEHQLPISVKGGAHHPNMLSLVNGGLVVDLSLMRGVFVDPVAKTAVVEGGAWLGDIDRATAPFQLAVPLGHAPVTGMGLALGGGMGVGMHLFGPTCCHIIGATVVLADGTMVRVDKEHDPDLLWGLRGAGAALGVVTSLTFRLHDVSNAYAGFLMIPDDPEHNNWRSIARWMVDVGAKHPRYSNNLIRGVMPDGKAILVLMLAHCGDESVEDKAAFIEPLRQCGPFVDTVALGGYCTMQFCLNPLVRAAVPNYEYWTSGQLAVDQLPDSVFDAYPRLLDDMPVATRDHSLWLFDMWRPSDPAVLQQLKEYDGPTALLSSTADYGWLVDLAYSDPSAKDEVQAFARKVKATLSHGDQDGLCVNVVTSTAADATDERLQARVGGAANLARLRALKARVDPANVFARHPLYGLVKA